MYSFIRPLLFKLEAEQAHNVVLSTLNWLPSMFFKPVQGQPIKAMGLNFRHPVGLAAGLDKNGTYLAGLAKLGFSFIELGTVTPRAQAGNPKPRLFRLPESQALLNRMGFNNLGVDVLVENVRKANYTGILGINIGKNKDTPLNHAADDYLFCLDKVYEHASYVTVNISSPNTPDLRELQKKEYFADLLKQLHQKQMELTQHHSRQVPLVVKISPDESEETIKEMVDVILEHKIEGIIATNTTASPDLIAQYSPFERQGGLSGAPLLSSSTRCIRLLKSLVGDSLTIIGVGGINSITSAQEKINAGASLIQIYSGLIYQGPSLPSELASKLFVPHHHAC